MRRRRSSSASSGISTWKGRIVGGGLDGRTHDYLPVNRFSLALRSADLISVLAHSTTTRERLPPCSQRPARPDGGPSPPTLDGHRPRRQATLRLTGPADGDVAGGRPRRARTGPGAVAVAERAGASRQSSRWNHPCSMRCAALPRARGSRLARARRGEVRARGLRESGARPRRAGGGGSRTARKAARPPRSASNDPTGRCGATGWWTARRSSCRPTRAPSRGWRRAT